MKRYILTALFLTMFCLSPPIWATVYVDVNNTGTEDGTSWSTAYNTVQEGVDAAFSAGGDDVWVAKGTYTDSGNIDIFGGAVVLQMEENVNIYGGFSGSETILADRDWETNTTILDGNGAVKHVVTGASNAIIDGFTITGGDASANKRRGITPRAGTTVDSILQDEYQTSGGGILIFQSAPTVSNCIIDGNTALKGGGVYVMVSTDGNLSADAAEPAPIFTNCTISNNYGIIRGGGVSIDVNSHPTFTGCKFISNTCGAKGGAMYNDWGCSPTLTNCLIVKNTAQRAAAMGNDGASSPKLINCTVADNYAYDIGAGIYTGSALYSTNNPILINCIVWGNDNQYGGPTDLSGWHKNHFYISYSDIGTGFTSSGTGILDNQDPLFTDAANNDYSLQAGSPCIDTGADSTIDTDIPADDLDGNVRDGNPDMGAYEYSGSVTSDGKLTVTISPDAAVTAGAQWNIDGGEWHDAGTLTVAAGTYTVNFSDVTGYTTPASQSVTVTSGGTQSLMGTYTEQFGSLTVTISPAEAVTAGAQWIVNGTTYNSGDEASLAAGTYTVSFTTVDGYDTPPDQSVTLTAGGAQSLTGTYTESPASLTVTLSPTGAVTAGAQWRVNGTSYNSGQTVSLDAGTYTVGFATVSGYDTPADQSVTLTAGESKSLTGTYTEQTGSLTVTIGPAEAVTAGAQWSIDGGTTWNDSGATLADLSVGNYTVGFKSIGGWGTPASTTATVTDGQTTSVSGTYTSDTGSITVTIGPQEAVDAGARWSVDSGATWRDSGVTVSDLAPGSQTITFKSISRWDTPADATATVTAGETAAGSGTYTETVYTLSNAITILQVLSGIIVQATDFPDPSGNGTTGMEDAIYILRYAAGTL